jgi:hypothetical protein
VPEVVHQLAWARESSATTIPVAPVDEDKKRDGKKDIQSEIEPMRERLVFEEAK